MDTDTKAMLQSIRNLLSESDKRKGNPAKQSNAKSAYNSNKVVNKQKGTNAKIMKKVKDSRSNRQNVHRHSPEAAKKISSDEAALKTLSLPFISTIFVVDESMTLIDRMDKNSTIMSKTISKTTIAERLEKAGGPESLSLSAEYFYKKYPRFCHKLKLKQNDVIATRPRSDIWLIRCMEDCYDEAMSASVKPVGEGRKRRRFGMELGALDAFPLIVRRFVSRSFSVLATRDRYCLDLLVSLENAITDRVTETTFVGDEDPAVNGHRAIVFAKFLTEEWDVSCVAQFLHYRDLFQRQLGVRFRDLAVPRVWDDSTKFGETEAETRRTQGANASSHGSPLVGSVSYADKLHNTVDSIRQYEVAIPVSTVSASKVPFVSLPQSMRFVNDSTLPETPLLSILCEVFGFVCGNLLNGEVHSHNQTEAKVLAQNQAQNKVLRGYLFRKVVTKLDVMRRDALRFLYAYCASSASSKKLISEALRNAASDVTNRTFPASIDGAGGWDVGDMGILLAEKVSVVPIFTLLEVLCEEWQAVPVDEKEQLSDTSESIGSLKKLQDIYVGKADNPSLVLNEVAAKLETEERALAQCEASILKLDKNRRRLERRWEDDCATAEDLLTLQDVRVGLTEAKANRVAINNRIVSIQKQKKNAHKKVDALWDVALANSEIPVQNVTLLTTESSLSWRDKVQRLVLAILRRNSEKETAKSIAMRTLENFVNEAGEVLPLSSRNEEFDSDEENMDLIEEEMRRLMHLPDSESVAEEPPEDIDASVEANPAISKVDEAEAEVEGQVIEPAVAWTHDEVAVKATVAEGDEAAGHETFEEMVADTEADRIYAELEDVISRVMRGEEVEEVTLNTFVVQEETPEIVPDEVPVEDIAGLDEELVRTEVADEVEDKMFPEDDFQESQLGLETVEESGPDIAGEAEVEDVVETVEEVDPEELEWLEVPRWLTAAVLTKVEQMRLVCLASQDRRVMAAAFFKLCKFSPAKIRNVLDVSSNPRLRRRVWLCWRSLLKAETAQRRWTILFLVVYKAFRSPLRRIKKRRRLAVQELNILTFEDRQRRQKGRAFISFWLWWARRSRRCKDTLYDYKVRVRYICFKKWRRCYIGHHSRALAAALKIQRWYRRRFYTWKSRSIQAAHTICRFTRSIHRKRLERNRCHYLRKLGEIHTYLMGIANARIQRRIILSWRLDHIHFTGVRMMKKTYDKKLLKLYVAKWRLLNALYRKLIAKSATLIQSIARMYIVKVTRLNYYHFRNSLVKYQAYIRSYIARKQYRVKLMNYYAARSIQRSYRGYRCRCDLHQSRLLDIHDAAESNDYDRLIKYCSTTFLSLLFELDIYGNTTLHNAAKTASKRTAKLLLRMNLDPNGLNVSGYTPLHLLIGSEAPDRDSVLQYLIERGFNEDIPTPDGKTCLLLACYYSRVMLVDMFLKEHHLDPHTPDHNGTTCLQIACSNGSYEIVDNLLAHGTDVHQSGYGGATPLHSVAYCGSVDIAKLLVSYGAYVNAQDELGQTPLMYACQQGFVDLVVYFIVVCGANVTATDYSGRTAVHHAAMSNHPPVMHALREADCNFDIVDNNGNTAMHLAAEQGYFETVRSLLQEGAHSSIQNLQGNQPLHLCARFNHVNVMRILVAYDKHIGRVNYQHETPLGIAKFYGAKAAQEFLEEQFYREQEEEVRDEEGNLWWDKSLDEVLDGWRVEVNAIGTREYINDYTGERRDTPPTLSSNLVGSAAEYVELNMKRYVQETVGDSAEDKEHTKNGYVQDVDDFNNEVEELRRDNMAQTVIAKYVRRRLAQKQVKQLRYLRDMKRRITRFINNTVPRWRAWKLRMINMYATRIQALARGYICRMYMKWYGGMYQLWYRKHGTELAQYVTRAWLYYKFNVVARITTFLMHAPKTRAAWKKVLDAAGKPRRVVGSHEEYVFPHTLDILFYRNVTTGRIFLGKPPQIEELDRLVIEEAKEIAKYGYTLRQKKLAIKMQALWRGYHARNYDLFVRRAVRISLQAEQLYFDNPNLDKNLINYALYTHVVQRDYKKASSVYSEALRRMVFRGPDVAFILYACAVFSFVSHELDVSDCQLMVERARVAEANRALFQAKNPEHKEDIQQMIDSGKFRYGNIFNLADRGFYRNAAVTSHCREGWHNYAACRFLVYDDQHGSLEAFLSAFRYDPGYKPLNENFHAMMSYYHGNDKTKINEMVNARMRQMTEKANKAKEREESRAEQALILSMTTLRVQRWYRRWHRKRTKVRRVSMKAGISEFAEATSMS